MKLPFCVPCVHASTSDIADTKSDLEPQQEAQRWDQRCCSYFLFSFSPLTIRTAPECLLLYTVFKPCWWHPWSFWFRCYIVSCITRSPKLELHPQTLTHKSTTHTHKHTRTQTKTNRNVVPATRTHSDGVSCPVFRCLHCYTFASLPAGPSSTGEGTSDEERPTSSCCACMPTCACMLGVCFCTFCDHAYYKCYD